MADPCSSQPPDPEGQQRKDPRSSVTSPSVTAVFSFASVTKTPSTGRFPAVRLAARQYGIKDGNPPITFTPTKLQAGVDNLKHSLVAKFAPGRPHIEDIRKTLQAAWNLGSKCSIGAWDSRHVLIILDSELEARKILAHPLRKVGHSMFRVFRWAKDFSSKREPTTTSTWVRLPSLPPEMYNQGYIASIVSSFGRFIAVDSRTSEFSNPSFARVCIEERMKASGKE
ncbi:hypothetical protein QQ045_004466 [Rhodiola kirilowii]